MTTHSEAGAENTIPQESSGLLDNEQSSTSYAAVENGGREEEQRSGEQRPSKARRITIFVLAVVLSTTVLATAWFASHYNSLRKRSYRPYGILNNGTHDFRQTLIMISMDGTVNDYLDRGITPNLDIIAADGVRAQYMNPSFPSVTFPNHWSLVTGLYPETHGIVGNVFYDPVLNQTFNYKSAAGSWSSKWWGGEPIWVTSELQNVTSAVIMWPGCSTSFNGIRPTYEVPFDDVTSSDKKMDQVLQWLDLPLEDRPQIINAYIQGIDQHGHKYGPYDNLTLNALHSVDGSLGRLLDGLKNRHLSDIVHIMVVSDHGMSESSNDKLIYYDDILDETALGNIWKTEGWPLLGIRAYPGKEDALDDIYQQLYEHSLLPGAKYEVFRRENMPLKYHFSHTQRVPPVIAIPFEGWNFVTHKQFNDPTKEYQPRGVHGYDNFARQSRAIFVAKGPFFDWDLGRGQRLKPFVNIEVYNVLSRILGLQPAENNGTLSGFLQSLY
ncbi:hypothetical protein INT44_000796 [Umbelopsis vinacea]|uniref:Phosphodiest-domain-containing protein n=1 Tax=Umbelopsis vinacea TaxID=44442 RepID=A0A8H7ULX8_9FUNG|nr:hypothetical protein INT44_000796 [Umbelopsis vinacea]